MIARGPVAKGLLASSPQRGEYGSPPRGKPARAELGHDRERVAAVQQVLGRVSAAAGRTPAQTALRFALAAPAVAVAIPGARSVAQLLDNVAAAACAPLGTGEADALRGAAPAQRYAAHR